MLEPQNLNSIANWRQACPFPLDSRMVGANDGEIDFSGTDGNADIAIDAIRAASHPHHFLGVTHQGLAAITRTMVFLI